MAKKHIKQKPKTKFNVINITLIVVIFLLVSLVGIKYYREETQDTFEFTGPNIYRAIYAYNILNQKGAEVLLDFKGKWVESGKEIEDVAEIRGGHKGVFTVIYKSKEITIGGPASSSEHIAVTSLSLTLPHSDVLRAVLLPLNIDTIGDLVDKLDRLSKKLIPANNIYNIAINGDVMFDTKRSMTPTIIQDIDNLLPAGNTIEFYQTGLRLKLQNADINDFENINMLLNRRGITVTRVATSQLEVLIRSIHGIRSSDEAMLDKVAQDIGVYSLKIITDPLQ
jgi:hypothetical protein